MLKYVRGSSLQRLKPALVQKHLRVLQTAGCTSRTSSLFESRLIRADTSYTQQVTAQRQLHSFLSSKMTSASPLSAAEKLSQVRQLLKESGVAAYIIPTADAHNSEYVCEHDKRRAYISGFDGSAGTAVITETEARLWTDGRYYLQANQQLDRDAGWQLMKDRLLETPTIEKWLASTLRAGSCVAIDPETMTIGAVKRLQGALTSAGLSLRTDGLACGANPVDHVWARDEGAGGQPPVPTAPLRVHPLQYAGVSVSDKLASLRASLVQEGCSALAISALDEVMWTFNIRGGDVECNPVALAYGLVTEKEAVLFIDEGKVTEEAAAHLAASGVTVQPYTSAFQHVRGIAEAGGKVWLDQASASWRLYTAAGQGEGPGKPSPVTLAKALKNEAEIEGMRAAHVRDGAALVTFMAWLHAAVTRGIDMRTGENITSPDSLLSEDSVSAILTTFRAQGQGFVCPSFDTIAGYGANGAIIHYRPKAGSSARVGERELFLLDSGGQYVDGTTDVTRTLHLGGAASERERRAYTAVLKGHIALATAVFPPGTSGIALDTLARSQLWSVGLDYRHGTGHGVGAFLNVHEGPQYVASAARSTYEGGMQAGMTISNEPGYYEDGGFGIRIEAVMVAHEAPQHPAPVLAASSSSSSVSSASSVGWFGGKPYLAFETLTVVPIQTRGLVAVELLSPGEKAWLNGYNQRCRDTLAPLVAHLPWALEYLLKETYPV